MQKRAVVAILAICLLLSGCDRIFDGHYSSVTPHQQQTAPTDGRNVSASDYEQLYDALAGFVEAGRTEGVIRVVEYDPDLVEKDMSRAAAQLKRTHPIAAYAVESINFELGKSGGKAALDLEISYTHNRAEILKIRQATGVNAATNLICNALQQCEPDLVLLVHDFKEMDFVQVVENYAMDYPQYVMEQPQVTVNVYPQSGTDRVVELRFTYQTSRDSLRNMQEQVKPVFESAALYVSGDGAQREKYAQLYSFLMERYDYQISGSITPAYSLLRHGVGDSRAFAAVYAAMCRLAGLECMVVSGTRNGQSCHWNIICDGGVYYHINLLEGSFRERTDGQMTGFVWDYSAYPPCGVAPEE